MLLVHFLKIIDSTFDLNKRELGIVTEISVLKTAELLSVIFLMNADLRHRSISFSVQSITPKCVTDMQWPSVSVSRFCFLASACGLHVYVSLFYHKGETVFSIPKLALGLGCRLGARIGEENMILTLREAGMLRRGRKYCARNLWLFNKVTAFKLIANKMLNVLSM